MRNLFNAIGQNWKVLATIMCIYLGIQYVPRIVDDISHRYKQLKFSIARSMVEDYLYENPITIVQQPSSRKEAIKYASSIDGERGDYIFIVWELQNRLESCTRAVGYAIQELDVREFQLTTYKEK